jgi:hypothetical protein
MYVNYYDPAPRVPSFDNTCEKKASRVGWEAEVQYDTEWRYVMRILNCTKIERRIDELCDTVNHLDLQMHTLTLEVQAVAGDDRYSDEEFVAFTQQAERTLRGLDLAVDRVMRKIKAMRCRSPANIVLRPLSKESEVKQELKGYMREMWGDDPLADTLCAGVDNMPEEKAEKILGDLQEYERRMPTVLAEVDELIQRIETQRA